MAGRFGSGNVRWGHSGSSNTPGGREGGDSRWASAGTNVFVVVIDGHPQIGFRREHEAKEYIHDHHHDKQNSVKVVAVPVY